MLSAPLADSLLGVEYPNVSLARIPPEEVLRRLLVLVLGDVQVSGLDCRLALADRGGGRWHRIVTAVPEEILEIYLIPLLIHCKNSFTNIKLQYLYVSSISQYGWTKYHDATWKYAFIHQWNIVHQQSTYLCLACTGALLFPPWCLITTGALSVPLSPSVSLVPVVKEFFSWLNIDEFRGLLPFVVELVSLSRIKVFRLSMAESSLVFVRKSMFSLVGVMSSIMKVLRLSASRASRRFLSCVDWFTCKK